MMRRLAAAAGLIVLGGCAAVEEAARNYPMRTTVVGDHVAEVDLATKAVKNQILVGKRAWGLGFTPDGKTLFVANGLSDDMTLIDTAAAKAIKTVPAGRVPHTILVSK